MDRLTAMLTKIDEGAARRALLEQYYRGTQPLAFLAPEARLALGTRFGRMASNVPRLAVTALAERLRIVGFRGADVWADWTRADMDQLAPLAHREALTLGTSYVIVWADAQGRPQVTVESAHQTAVERDPATREITAAIKRWETPSGATAVLYEADTITRWHSDAIGATTGFKKVQTLDNPFGVPPVVELRNSDRLLGAPASEIDDLIPLVDGLNKALVDMLTTSEYVGRPRRWATGIELVNEVMEDGSEVAVNPFPEGSRMMISESPDTKFGQLDAADLAGYESAVRVLEGQIAAVSALPAHYLGILGDQPPSADSLRAAEASLTARAEARQATFGRAWEAVARLMVAVRTGADPLAVDVTVQWADAATRSIAQEADAIVKLYGAGLLPATYALKRLGYSDDEIRAIRADGRADALDKAGTDLTSLLS